MKTINIRNLSAAELTYGIVFKNKTLLINIFQKNLNAENNQWKCI